MRSRVFQHLRNLSNTNVHAKVFLNQVKVGDYLLQDISLRKLIPPLEKLKLYIMNVYYKDNGEYYLTELKNLFLVVDAEDRLVIFEPVKYENSKIYLKIIRNYSLIGHATKKIMIEETTKYKLYDIHVCSVHSEASVGQPRIYHFNKSIILASDEEIFLTHEVSKKLNKYKFQTNKIVCSEGCEKNENGWITDADTTNKIYVEVNLEREKRWRERMFEFFKKLFLDY